MFQTFSMQDAFEVALPLFLIMDPVGNAAASLAILREHTPSRQRAIIRRELVFALAIVLLFHFLGDALLGLLDIEQSTLRLSGGIILFIIAMKMVFPPAQENDPEAVTRDPFIVPIAVPLIAGPSLLAAVMVYARQAQAGMMGQASVLGGVLMAWGATALVMAFTPDLARILGPRAMRAMERLMGLILILMAVQMLENGIRIFVQSL
jgi:multiple antibiotic resistance protein